MVSQLLILVDTSYWLELFKVPHHFNKHHHEEIKNRFEKAFNDKAGLFLPLPGLYELGNHIAQVKDGNKRKELADKLFYTIFDDDTFLTVTPANPVEELREFLQKFKEEYVIQAIGLVDTLVIHEAWRLKKSTNRVHIWTTDHHVKAHEPDKEFNPFVGKPAK